MKDFYAVIGVRWVKRNGRWRVRKQFHCVSKDRISALEIADYLNNTQTKHVYSVEPISSYDSLSEYLYFEV